MHRILYLLVSFILFTLTLQVSGQSWRAIPQQLEGRAFNLSADGNVLVVSEKIPGELQRYEWKQERWQAVGQPIMSDSNYGFFYHQYLAIDGRGDRIMAIATQTIDSQAVYRVHIFHWRSNKWLYRGVLKESPDVIMGIDFSYNGNTAVVSDRTNSDSLTHGGVIDVFTWEQNSWRQKGNRIFGDTKDRGLGYSLSVSGDGNHIVANNNRGNIYVYHWNGQQWIVDTQLNSFLIFRSNSHKSFDFSFDGIQLAVGEPNTVSTSYDPGSVWVAEQQSNSWSILGDTINGTSNLAFAGFNTYLNPVGNMLMISMPGNPIDDQIHQYEWTGNTWQLTHTITGDFDNSFSNYPFFAVNDSMNRLVRYDQKKIATYILDTLTTGEPMQSMPDIQLYPNPATKAVTLSWDAPGAINCQVYDLLGRLQFQQHCESCQRMTISTAGWATGIYPISLEINGKMIDKKLVVID